MACAPRIPPTNRAATWGTITGRRVDVNTGYAIRLMRGAKRSGRKLKTGSVVCVLIGWMISLSGCCKGGWKCLVPFFAPWLGWGCAVGELCACAGWQGVPSARELLSVSDWSASHVQRTFGPLYEVLLMAESDCAIWVPAINDGKIKVYWNNYSLLNYSILQGKLLFKEWNFVKELVDGYLTGFFKKKS